MILYDGACAPCHGATGKGDGKLLQRDSAGRPTWPRDLALGIFKGGATPDEIYKRVVLGLPGSPMPSNPFFHGNDGWALTELILSMTGKERHPWSLSTRRQLIAQTVDQLPSTTDADEWKELQSIELPLMPLQAERGRPPVIEIVACYEAGRLALAVDWTGAPAASVQFSGETAPAYFAGENNGALSGRCDETGCRAVFIGVPGDGLKVLISLWDGHPLQQTAISVWTELVLRAGP